MRKLSAWLRLFRDCRAVASIEMAFALPVMCMMTYALYEVTQGIICYMKVSDVANSVANLVGQTNLAQGGIGNTEFDNFFVAGKLMMNPNDSSYLGIAIASVYFDATGNNPVQAWHVERGGAAAISNATSFVSSVGTANSSAIVVKVTYSYHSLLNYFITTPINISVEVAAEPRNLLPPAYTQGIPCPPPVGSESCS